MRTMMRLAAAAAMVTLSAGPLPAQARTEVFPSWDVVTVAHRGLSAGRPENTLAAFRSAISLGVQAIELDLRGTADGHVVVLHDAMVDRTTDGRGDVTGMLLREVKALDAGRHAGAAFIGERVPTYEEVLQLARGSGVTLLLDIKISPALNKAHVVALTERYGATLNVIVGVRSLQDLREFRALNPNLRTLGFVENVGAIETFVQSGIDIVRLWPEWMHADPALVSRVHRAGRPVWTTAGPMPREELKTLIQMGVNGILTDVPEVLVPLLTELRAARR